MKQFLIRSDLSISVRLRMIRCYITPLLLYGCETWILDASTEISKCICTAECNAYRISRLQQDNSVFGAILRGPRYDVSRLIIEGKIEGRYESEYVKIHD